MMAPYRPPGRSNRSGRSNADNDVFEGLPVKQWGQAFSRVSLAPPVSETQNGQDDKWADPPMPRDFQMLHPWTQHLLRLARSGKVGTKRKQESDPTDDERPEDETTEEAAKTTNNDDRGYIAKKWKPVPEHMLVQEHKHFEFLAKRRRGLPNLYSPDQLSGAVVQMRKTKVQKADANGEIALYEVLVPEGQAVDGEVTDTTELPDVKPVVAAPGTVIEGVGVANDEGVLVAEHLKPSTAPRRNRPPPKKKGGPGRGKKRVTFTNPDGSTYTTIVPNATKIVPQPGQIVKHVAKGEEASADVTAEEAAAAAAARQDDDVSGSDDGEDDGDDDDDREEGELSDDDAPGTGAATPAKPQTPAKSSTPALPTDKADDTEPMEDVRPSEQTPVDVPRRDQNADQNDASQVPTEEAVLPLPAADKVNHRDPSSSPDVPLATNTHSRTGSMAEPPPFALETEALTELAPVEHTPAEPVEVEPVPVKSAAAESAPAESAPTEPAPVGPYSTESAPTEPPAIEPAPIKPSSVEPAIQPEIALPVGTEPNSVESAPPAELVAPVESVAPIDPAVVSEPITEKPAAVEMTEAPKVEEQPSAEEVEPQAEPKLEKVEELDDDLLGGLEKYTQPEKQE